MATYKEINGTAVQNYAGDLPGAVDGQLWYNSTATTFQFQYGATAAAWSTGGSLNTAKGSLAGAGIQTAALAFGGNVGTPTYSSATEEYDGTSWTTSPASLSTTRQALGGAGTQAAALGFGGNNPTELAATEEWTGAGSPLTKTITVS